jgi:hypothetical protein
LLYTTIQASSAGGQTELTGSVYRLVENDSSYDWYMVLTDPSRTPNFTADFGGGCNGFDACDWHTISSATSVLLAEGILTDHGPTGTITTSTTGFSIGGSLTPAGPVGTAAFSSFWATPSLTTTDNSNSGSGAWSENVQFGGYVPCNPIAMPDVSSGTFISHQGSIFSVPEGTQTLSIPLSFSNTTCSYYSYVTWGTKWDTTSISTTLSIGVPQFSVYPMELTIPAGSSRALLINADIPNSTENLAWNVIPSGSKGWLDVPNGPFAGSQGITVRVEPGTPEAWWVTCPWTPSRVSRRPR